MAKKIKRLKFRSKFEKRMAENLRDLNIPIDYENVRVSFVEPSKERTYTPDFILPNGIIIEAKGRLTIKARQKHEWIRESHPDLDIRFVFQNANNKIYKGSKTSYGEWADQKGFKWSQKKIPLEWIKEAPKAIKYGKKIRRIQKK